MLSHPIGYATLIDTHREYDLRESHFPTPKTLKQLGIEKIVYLNESPVGKLDNIPRVKDLMGIFQNYQTSGFEIEAYGIDLRQGFR